MTHQIALVTGASRGIGSAISIALADAGFDVALNDLQHSDNLDRVAAQIEAMGRKTFKALFDVSDISVHVSAIAEIEDALGALTTLVNNAGVGVVDRGDPLDVREVSFDRCMAVNAKGNFFLTQAFAKRLLARERSESSFHSIVNVTSSNAVAVAVPRSEYCASKAAASMISKCFAARLGPEGVFVYDVQPGLIETPMTKSVMESYITRASDGLCIIPRVGQPDDVAKVVASLSTNCLPYTTGHVISVDGGMLVPRF